MDQNQQIRYQLHSTMNPLAAYAELPNTGYEDQQAGEQVEILLRRHMITNAGWITLSLVGLVVPPVLHLLQPTSWVGMEWLSAVPQQTASLATILWYLIVAAFALTNFLDWYYNVYLVTTERLVDVDFIGLLQYSASEAALHQIQDVEHRQNGLWELLFNYGTVEAQTAGTVQNIIFERVPKPSRVTDIVTDLLPHERDIRETTEGTETPSPAASPAPSSEPTQ